MPQYDAGPGDWSDREWEAPDFEPQTHAKRRRVVLPPWAVLAIAIAVVILLCVGSIALIGALGGGDDEETPTPEASPTFGSPATATLVLLPSATIGVPVAPTATQTPPPPPPEAPSATPEPVEIAPGVTVTVKGTGCAGLNLRRRPTTNSRLVTTAKDGATLLVLDGPEEGEGYVWWQVQTEAGNTGWAVDKRIVLGTGE